MTVRSDRPAAPAEQSDEDNRDCGSGDEPRHPILSSFHRLAPVAIINYPDPRCRTDVSITQQNGNDVA